MQARIAEPRLAAVFDIYVRATEAADRLLENVAFPGVNCADYGEALGLVISVGQAAERLITHVMRMKIDGEIAAFETVCDALKQWDDG